MGMNFAPVSHAQLTLAGVLTATPTGTTPAGLYVQTSGTPPSGIALGDIFSWSGSAAILYRTFAIAPSAVTVSGTTWIKANGNWAAIGAPVVVSGPVTIEATITAPTKPTARTVDYITVIDNGSGWCDLQMMLSAESGAAGATAGNGIYLFSLPGGYKFDTATHPVISGTGIQIANAQEVSRMIPGSKGFASRTDPLYMDLVAATFDATRFFMFIPHTWHKVRSDYFSISASNVGYQMAFRFKKG